MKRLFRNLFFVFLIATMILAVAACGSSDKNGEASGEADKSCEHVYEENILTPAMALKDGLKEFTCSSCGDTYTERIPKTKSIKVLAIGDNSTIDAMEYLWNICKDGRAETIVLGNLVINEGTLDNHKANIESDAAKYTYNKNTAGKWVAKTNVAASTVFAEEDWDVIVLQQSAGKNAEASTYLRLPALLDILSEKNPDAEFYWHMTWAYRENTNKPGYTRYLNDQKTEYHKIVAAVKSVVLKDERISGVIPVGTTIQNLRTTYFQDTVTRDSYNLNYMHGRYTAALTWYACLTGGEIKHIDWYPPVYKAGLSSTVDIVRSTVRHAIESPLVFVYSEFAYNRK